MIKTIKTTLASFLMLVMGLQMSVAQGLSANDIAFAFGGVEPGVSQEVKRSAPAPQMLSMEEMRDSYQQFLKNPYLLAEIEMPPEMCYTMMYIRLIAMPGMGKNV